MTISIDTRISGGTSSITTVSGEQYLVGADGTLYPLAAIAATISERAAYADEFGVWQRGVPSQTIGISATGQLPLMPPFAIVGVRCVAAGSSGTFALYDDTSSGNAAQLRFSRTQAQCSADLTAGVVRRPAVLGNREALLFTTGAYATITTGGKFAVDVIDGLTVPGLLGDALLCESELVSATGVALYGPATLVSLVVLANAASSGNLEIWDDVNAATSQHQRYPTTAHNATHLAAGSVVDLNGMRLSNTYLVVPTGMSILLTYLPR